MLVAVDSLPAAGYRLLFDNLDAGGELLVRQRRGTMTNPKGGKSMCLTRTVRELNESAQLLQLVEDAERVLGRTQGRLRTLPLLVTVSRRLAAQRRRLLEDAITDLLWQYLETGLEEKRATLVRQLIADIGVGQQ